MKSFMKRGGFASIFAVLVLVFAPLVMGEPEVLTLANSAYSVSSADYFEFAPGQLLGAGTTWTITAPSGQNLTLVRTSADNPDSPGPVSFFLNGAQRSGEAGLWTSTGNLLGYPGDGTWQLSVTSQFYATHDSFLGSSSQPYHYPHATLSVNSSSITFGANPLYAGTATQFWNQHETVGNWREPSTSNQFPGLEGWGPGDDPLNEGPEEDPFFSRYYRNGPEDPSTPEPETNPSAFTSDHTVSCTDSIDIRGLWAKGQNQEENTTGYFAYGEGFHTEGDTLLSTTTLTDFGGSFTGSHNATIPYNNLNGNSYQFIVRNGTGGVDRAGAVLYAPPEQCNQPLPDLGQFEHNEDEFQVKVSQGQCSVDNTTINVMSDDPVEGNDVLEVYLGNAETGLVLLTWTQDDFFEGPAFQYFFLSTYIPPGDYILLATVDAQGLGQNDMFDTVPFNVKQGSCEKPSLEDVTVLVQTSVLNATLDELKEHRNHTLEVMGADFEGLSFDGFLIMLLLASIFAISIWHGWTFPALVSGMGVAMQFMDTAPIGFVGIVYLLIIGFFMEYFIGGLAGIRKRFRSGKHDEEEGSAF